ncbi:response regulator transcription factor [Amycolatopsis sp. H20-H5]|uniref:response regulator transcription factor n=1 Tax=Amycolatopsis sp. H20-H5 TaxID=3046309 RepID=UPI002DB63728|nr:response regulator transcription factor [Amycolatopsis sp. H20-H5]MEC3981669.1 response regulator transcription factor [Amycolatopsis sp. H20-H5]
MQAAVGRLEDGSEPVAGRFVRAEQPEVATAVGFAGIRRGDVAQQFTERAGVLVLLDAGSPDGDGVELCRELRSMLPGLNCLMLTSFTDEQAMMNAILAGADGYVIKDIKGMQLVEAVRQVGAGRSLLDNRAVAALMARLRKTVETPGPLAGLTEQERTLLDLIGEGLTNRQIAERMFLAEKTVKNYVSRLLAKLGMERRTQAAVLVTGLRDAAPHTVE